MSIVRIHELTPEVTRDLVELGEQFTAEAGLEKFDPGSFIENFHRLMRTGGAAIWLATDDGVVAGAIGGVLAPCPFTGVLTAIESFWFVRKDRRSGTSGIRLLKTFEMWTLEMGVDRVHLACMEAINPERIGEFYKNYGYEKLETVYVRRQQWRSRH